MQRYNLAMSRRTTLTTAKGKRAFLDLLRSQVAASGLPNVSSACRAVGVSRTSAYAAKAVDTVFNTLWEDIVDSAYESLERNAYDRAVGLGDARPSDLLTIFLLKGRYARYRDNQPATTAIDARGSSLVINLGAAKSDVRANSVEQSANPRKGRGRIFESTPGGTGDGAGTLVVDK